MLIQRTWFYATMSAVLFVIMRDGVAYEAELIGMNYFAATLGAVLAYFVPLALAMIVAKLAGFIETSSRRLGVDLVCCSLWLGFVSMVAIARGQSGVGIPLPPPGVSESAHYMSEYLGTSLYLSMWLILLLAANDWIKNRFDPIEKIKRATNEYSYEMLEWQLSDTQPVKYRHETNPRYDDLPESIRDYRSVTQEDKQP